MKAETEDESAVVPSEGFPLWSSLSFDEATLGPLSTGAEFEEFSTVAAYDVQSRVNYSTI